MSTDSLNVRLAGVNCCFEKALFSGFWNTCGWKLDPFRAASACPAAFSAGRAGCFGAAVSVSGSPLLQKEVSGFFTHTVHALPDGGTLWACGDRSGPIVQYRLSADFSRAELLLDNTQSAGSVAFEYMTRFMPAVWLGQGALSLHACLLEYRGEAVALCAVSGTGKTTHGRLWRDHLGAFILNGDRAVLRRGQNGWEAYGTPWSGTSGEQMCRKAPLKAVVVLERGETNSAVPLTPAQAFEGLLPHLQWPQWDRALSGAVLEKADELLGEVPAWHLRCRPDSDAVEVLYRAVWEG